MPEPSSVLQPIHSKRTARDFGRAKTGAVLAIGCFVLQACSSGSDAGADAAAGTGGRLTASGGRDGGSGTGGSNATDGGASACKRGIAANTAPGAAFFPGVGWWYNWSTQTSGGSSAIEFVPMLWGSGSLGASIPNAAKYVLGFNEPNFKTQANLSATQSAGHWPTVEAKAAGRPIVSPGMNFCGPAADCHGTDPYKYLKDFFAACTDCQVDYVAVHWYNCDLPSLRDYLEPGGNLEGFEQFGKPIWLTEFSCDPSASVAEQEAYMRVAIPYLESNPKVFRYAWFSADPIPAAKLINADGSPTALGKVYTALPQGCE